MSALYDAHTNGSAQEASSSRLASLSSAPVGIFDSGLGGLSVLRAVRAELPDEALVYVADSAYAPYGQRDEAFIAERTLAIVQWLISQGAKALVVACNTATAQAISLVRERLAIPLIGVEPGIKPAALQS
jgi:glutamate racemase